MNSLFEGQTEFFAQARKSTSKWLSDRQMGNMFLLWSPCSWARTQRIHQTFPWNTWAMRNAIYPLFRRPCKAVILCSAWEGAIRQGYS